MLTNVVLVGGDDAAILKLHRVPEDADQIWPAALHVKAVAGVASKLLKHGSAILSQAADWRRTRNPRLIIGGSHDHDFADHPRVHGAAVLRAEKVISPGLGGSEPQGGVTAGQDVLLDAERRNKEAVDHVLRGHDQLDVFVHRHMRSEEHT